MPNKALLNGAPVFADTVSGTGEFICAECESGMYYKRAGKRADGIRIRAHFAHNPQATGSTLRECSTVGMSDEHRNAQTTIRLAAPTYFAWLSGCVGDEEHRMPLPDGTHRRADVYFERPDGRRIVFEPQFTKIPRRQIAERTRDYHDLGCDVVWCFPEKRDDLFTWAKHHFYCAGQLSDDGNDVSFWGNLNPDKYPPGLRKPFDAETDPGEWDHGRSLSERWQAAPNEFTDVRNPPRTMMRDSSVANAYKAWMACGSMGLSRWLGDYKKRQTGKRFYTVEEIGDWIAACQTMEFDQTGELNEFCQGAA